MTLEGKGTLHIYKSKAFVSLPSALWKDSAFNFKDKEKVEIVIEGNKLVVRKIA